MTTEWTYRGQIIDSPGEFYGFVYLITNKLSNKKYIGKKLFWSKKRKSVKGKSKRIVVESDWKTYWSSSEDLKSDVKKLGEENFTREILHLCPNKGTANYLEAKEQFINEVLEKRDMWYNSWIQCKIHYSHLKK